MDGFFSYRIIADFIEILNELVVLFLNCFIPEYKCIKISVLFQFTIIDS